MTSALAQEKEHRWTIWLWRNCWINYIGDSLNHWSGSRRPGSMLHGCCGTCNWAAITEGEVHMSKKEMDEFGSEVWALVLYSKYSQHSYDAILTWLMGVQANNMCSGRDGKHSVMLPHSCKVLLYVGKGYWVLAQDGLRMLSIRLFLFSFFFFFVWRLYSWTWKVFWSFLAAWS